MLKTNNEKMEKIAISVDTYVTEVRNLSNRLMHIHQVIEKDSYGMNTEKVKRKIEKYQKMVTKEATAIENMGTALEKATIKYQNMENDVISYFTGITHEKVTNANNTVNQKQAEQKNINKFKNNKLNESLYKKNADQEKKSVSKPQNTTTKNTKTGNQNSTTKVTSSNPQNTTASSKASAAGKKAASYALSQVGIKEKPGNDVKYNDWYFHKKTGNGWCSTFVLYCANKGGLMGKGKPLPSNASAEIGTLKKFYEDRNRMQSKTSGYKPKEGDIAFFTSDSSQSGYHVGMVTGYNAKTKEVTIVEGNYSDKVAKNVYKINNCKALIGFGQNTL